MALFVALAALPALAAPVSNADAEVAFTFGLAAFHRGDYQQAVDRFATAVAADPGDGTARYWLGLAYLALGDGERAEAELTAARAAERPPRVEPARLAADLERARQLAAGGRTEVPPAPEPVGQRLQRFGRVPRWEVELRASLGHDSNPLLLADGVLATSPDGSASFDGAQSDTVVGFGLRAAAAPLRTGRWTLALVGEGYQSLGDELDFLDFTRLGAAMHLAWGGDPGGFVAGPLGYARVPVENRRFGLLLQAAAYDDAVDGDGYLGITAAAASLFWRQGAAGATRLSAAYFDQDFDADGSGVFAASGTVTEVELEQTFFFGSRHRFLRLVAAAGERDAGAAFDGSTAAGRAELALPLSERWTLTLAGGVEQIERDNVESNPLFGIFPVDEARQDSIARLGAVLSWALTPRLLLTGRLAYSERNADLGPVAEQFVDLDYQRTVAALGLRWTFLGGGG